MVQVVIAARGGLKAKSRCADALDAHDRARLVCIMLEDMLDAVARCDVVSQAWVATPTAAIAAIAADRGARVVRQARPNGLNPALRQAAAEVSDHAPYAPILMLPGDLPLLEPDDLAAAALLVRTMPWCSPRPWTAARACWPCAPARTCRQPSAPTASGGMRRWRSSEACRWA
jgi:2-phospho-L-lactate guanylyltransferase (CobY/MobA/RfbA family)